MYLELAEALDCPQCRSGAGLVAFVGEAAGRRVLTGWLGCPLCEIDVPVTGGVICLDDPAPAADAPPVEDLVVRLAALLGVAERSGVVVLLGPGLGAQGPELARLAERAEVIAWVDEACRGPFEPDELEVGFDPLAGASTTSWPIRAGSLDGVALLGAAPEIVAEAERALKPGGRLVLIAGPASGAVDPPASGFVELARDESAWVGERA